MSSKTRTTLLSKIHSTCNHINFLLPAEHSAWSKSISNLGHLSSNQFQTLSSMHDAIRLTWKKTTRQKFAERSDLELQATLLTLEETVQEMKCEIERMESAERYVLARNVWKAEGDVSEERRGLFELGKEARRVLGLMGRFTDGYPDAMDDGVLERRLKESAVAIEKIRKAKKQLQSAMDAGM